MNGLVTFPLADAAPLGVSQRTVKAAIDCVGIGVHSGRKARLVIRPAAADHGIVFRRTDSAAPSPARFDTVCDTRLCTVWLIPPCPPPAIGTVEHVDGRALRRRHRQCADRG